MKSRVSCCNGALLRRDLTRSALIWGAYFLILFVTMPSQIMSRGGWADLMQQRSFVAGIAMDGCHSIQFFYGAAMAWFLFSYLNKSRSTNFFGALPLRRETQFLTHYIAGLLAGLVPNFLLALISVLAGAFQGHNLLLDCAIFFGAHMATYLFYYSFAVLCAMVVGHIIAMPLLYGVLNFVVVVVEAVVRDLGSALIYGVDFGSRITLGAFSPFYDVVFDGNGPDYSYLWEQEIRTGIVYENYSMLYILAAVGVVFAVGAFLIYQRRRMEAAGDVMAVRHLRPVFLWCFTFGSTLVIGSVLASIIVPSMRSAYFMSIAGCLLVATVVGHFLGEMILQKSLRVFRKKTFVNCAIACVLAAAVLTCCRLDVLGISAYVPAESEIAGVALKQSGEPVDDARIIQQVRALHMDVLEQREVLEAYEREPVRSVQMISFTYTLHDGTEIDREYRVPDDKTACGNPNSFICRYEDLSNTKEMILAREDMGTITTQSIAHCLINYRVPSDLDYHQTLSLTTAEMVDLWYDAMLPDLEAGNMGTVDYTHFHEPTTEYKGYADTVAVPMPEEFHAEVSVEVALYTDDENEWKHRYYNIPVTAVHTIAALQELGVPAEAFQFTE